MHRRLLLLVFATGSKTSDTIGHETCCSTAASNKPRATGNALFSSGIFFFLKCAYSLTQELLFRLVKTEAKCEAGKLCSLGEDLPAHSPSGLDSSSSVLARLEFRCQRTRAPVLCFQNRHHPGSRPEPADPGGRRWDLGIVLDARSWLLSASFCTHGEGTRRSRLLASSCGLWGPSHLSHFHHCFL